MWLQPGLGPQHWSASPPLLYPTALGSFCSLPFTLFCLGQGSISAAAWGTLACICSGPSLALWQSYSNKKAWEGLQFPACLFHICFKNVQVVPLHESVDWPFLDDQSALPILHLCYKVGNVPGYRQLSLVSCPGVVLKATFQENAKHK